MTPQATILISTKDRCEELLRAVESALRQTVACEIVVIDDGSTDGTAQVLARRFPMVRCVRFDNSAGYIVRRNQGAELATAPILVSIDDDAIFTSHRTIEQTLTEFAEPRVGAVAIPFVDVRHSTAARLIAPKSGSYVTAAYVGTAHALRRDLFLRLGGYRSVLVHQGEESDYCLRMLAAGYVTLVAKADPIQHIESPRRDWTRMDIFGRRNDVLFAWYNVPAPHMIAHIAVTSVNGVCHGWKQGRLWNMVRGLSRGYVDAVFSWRERQPVSASIYRLFRRLKKKGPLRLSEVEAALPAQL